MFKETKRAVITDTLIGQGTHAEGKMVSDASIRIEGEYKGDIECKGDVIIGECGVAKSNIVAKELTVAGKIFGDVETKGRLTITATGQVHGNVSAQALLVQDGGVFNGSCRMERPAEQKSRQSAESEQAKDGGKDASSAAKEAREKARQAV